MALMPCYDNFCSDFDNFHHRFFDDSFFCPRKIFHHWRVDPWCHRSCLAGSVSVGSEGFQVVIDVHHFKANEIVVKIADDIIIIEGKQNESNDGPTCISRQFIRKYKLPRGYDSEKVVSTLSSDGILVVKAPMPPKKDVEEKIVAIEEAGPYFTSASTKTISN